MKRIVVVEDDAVSARMLRDFLTAQGYDALVASNGVLGLELFHSEKPDLMIVDVALPMKNGFELCFEIKRTEHGRDMPILLMSAVYQDADHAEAYAKKDLRADGWLSKPFDLRTLLERVERLIGLAS